jgi:WD40 repeat protein
MLLPSLASRIWQQRPGTEAWACSAVLGQDSAHFNRIPRLAFSPKGSMLLSCDKGGLLILWHTPAAVMAATLETNTPMTVAPIRQWTLEGGISSIAWQPSIGDTEYDEDSLLLLSLAGAQQDKQRILALCMCTNTLGLWDLAAEVQANPALPLVSWPLSKAGYCMHVEADEEDQKAEDRDRCMRIVMGTEDNTVEFWQVSSCQRY